MGVSYSIITKREAQENSAWKEHIETLKMFGNPNFSTDEINNNFPTLNEIYESIAEANIKIEKEMKQIDNIKCKEGKKEIIHSLDLRDDEAQGSEDFTMQYPESADDKYKIEVLLGIKSDIRILVKLFSAVSKKCGSFFIVNPYEAYFVDKDRSYEDIWKDIQQSWMA